MDNHILYIIRGLPGSGKTTLAKNLTQPHNSLAVADRQDRYVKHSMHAADDFFYDKDGNYKFNPELLPRAHANCHDAVEADMVENYCSIAVHNTFSQRWEVAPYYELAVKYGYFVVVIECQNNFGSVHGVPQSSIDAMAARWETLGPVPQPAQGRKEREERKMQTEDDIASAFRAGEDDRDHGDQEEDGNWEDSKPVVDKGPEHEKEFQDFLNSKEMEAEASHWGEMAQEYADEQDEELHELLTNPRMLEQPSHWCGGEDGSTSWEDHLIDLFQGHRERCMSEIRDREAQAESTYDVVRKINIKLVELEKIQLGE